MKIRLLPIFTVVLLLLTSCSKKEDCDDPIDCLPAITQKGANTAGCLVNGEVLLPGGQGINTGSVLKAIYNYSSDSDSVFGLSIRDLTSGGSKMMLISIRNRELMEGEIYELTDEESNSFGSYINGLNGFVTNEDNRGELTISKIDTERHIASGTFWFDAVDDEGEIVKIRNGRFDVQYYTSQ